jgi:hypothetical protein
MFAFKDSSTAYSAASAGGVSGTTHFSWQHFLTARAGTMTSEDTGQTDRESEGAGAVLYHERMRRGRR